jgi:hypothetical protein
MTCPLPAGTCLHVTVWFMRHTNVQALKLLSKVFLAFLNQLVEEASQKHNGIRENARHRLFKTNFHHHAQKPAPSRLAIDHRTLGRTRVKRVQWQVLI